MSGDRHATRTATIEHHYRQALQNDRRATVENIARGAVTSYHERTPLNFRTLNLAPGNDATNAKRIGRWLDPFGPGDLPADFEEHVVNALPEPHRSNCIADLAKRYGLMAAKLPCGDDVGIYQGIGCVMKETGEFIHVVAGDPQTPAEIDRAIKEGEEAMAAIASKLARLKQRRPVLKVAG